MSGVCSRRGMTAFNSPILLNDSRECRSVSPQFLERINKHKPSAISIRPYRVCTLLDDAALVHHENVVQLMQHVKGMSHQNSSSGSKRTIQEAVIENGSTNVRIHCR